MFCFPYVLNKYLTMSKFVQLFKRQFVEPAQKLHGTLQHNYAKDGGWLKRSRGILMTQMRVKDLRSGRLVGKDKYGNSYYENTTYFMGRNRWVDYNTDSWEQKWSYDASQVPPEWHGWLHQMTDKPPTEAPPTQRKFMLDHQESQTGKSTRYVPYSTTKPKIETWKPN